MAAENAPEMPQDVGGRTRMKLGWIRRGRGQRDRVADILPPANMLTDATDVPPEALENPQPLLPGQAPLESAIDPSAGESPAKPDRVPPDAGMPDQMEAEFPDGTPHLAGRGLGSWTTIRIPRPAPLVAQCLAIAFALAFVGGLTYYGARKFTRDAADGRASEEANSLAKLGALSATGDAFDGYLQILRYAEDPIVSTKESNTDERRGAMQRLLFLNTNKLASLAVVGRDGLIFATTDPAITDVRTSEAFNRTRADLNPTNSDIILSDDTSRGYVEFTTPLREPDGAVWAILYGRADPDRLWSTTLRTSVDGSRNVIVNSEGLFSAGVPDDLLRLPWRGQPLENGSVRADIVGVDSICGIGPIGQGTQIDHGWYVASCLPVSLIQTEASRAMGRQALVTSASAVLAFVIASGLLSFAASGRREAASLAPASVAPLTQDSPFQVASLEPTPAPAIKIEEPPAPPPPPTIVADVDALRLIEAYEARAARVSDQLREMVQAPLLIAATQADEAYRLREDEPERAAELHAQAMAELAALRDRELRNIGQEMHPALIRLGLPGAIRAFAKELGETMTLSSEIDPLSDGVGGGTGRVAIDAPRRLIVFRAVRAAVASLKDAGATACDLSLARDGDWLRLRLNANLADGGAMDAAALAPDIIAFAAYGGQLSCTQDGAGVIVSGGLPAPGIELPHEPLTAADDAEDRADSAPEAPSAADATAAGDEDAEEGIPAEIEGETQPPAMITFAAPLHGPGESLGGAIRELVAEMTGTIDISLDAAGIYDEPGAIDAELAGSLRMLVGVASQSLAAAGSPKCAVSLQQMGADLYLSVMSDTGGDGFDGDTLTAATGAVEARGGYVSVNRRDGAITITAEIPGDAPAVAETPVAVQIGPLDDVPKVVQLERAPVDP